MASDSVESLDARLNGETAKLPWRELQRHFARGVVREVSPSLDLIDVARRIIDNDTAQVQRWSESGDLCVPSDATALHWFESEALVWAVVVAPWVLVQAVDVADAPNIAEAPEAPEKEA